MELVVEPLDKTHARNLFNCGDDVLSEFLQKYALQNQKSNISKTFVLVDEGSSKSKKQVIGFYTLCSGQIHIDELPQNIKHPRYPVSIIRLARLATDLNYQGQGLGGYLLYDALIKARSAAEIMGIFAVVVDAKNANAKAFYKYFGFTELNTASDVLFLPMKTIKSITL